MHMSDALLSPAVGGAMWAASAAAIAVCASRLKREEDDSRLPLMAVLGAFVFAAQMINFAIPGTGSSGHLGGGLLLAILLGPWAGFLTIASILTVQALFFADGGLLALGSNIFNLGFFPCFIAWPLLYRPLTAGHPGRGRTTLASVIAAVVGLQLGAAAVALQTVGSGIAELPLSAFLPLMLSIHLAIGVMEGLVTAAVVLFLLRARPEALYRTAPPTIQRRLVPTLLLATVVTGALLSWFASEHPDGLEWSISQAAGVEELEPPAGRLHSALASVQELLSFLPDYNFPSGEAVAAMETSRPLADPGKSLAGLVGGLITLLLTGGIGWVVRRQF